MATKSARSGGQMENEVAYEMVLALLEYVLAMAHGFYQTL